MFLHQFGDDFVLALELVAESGDGAEVLGLGRRDLAAFEGRGPVLEELLLPEVE
jgi:hypothetical protein